jgi:hypothetical protein
MQCMYEDCCSMLRSLIILLCIPIELMVKFPPWSKRNYNNTSTYITVFGLPLVEQDSDGKVTTLSILTTTYRTPNPPLDDLPIPPLGFHILIEAGAKQRIQQSSRASTRTPEFKRSPTFDQQPYSVLEVPKLPSRNQHASPGR